jgi:hypothetical protein
MSSLQRGRLHNDARAARAKRQTAAAAARARSVNIEILSSHIRAKLWYSKKNKKHLVCPQGI